jgi:hypothetical protein
LNTVKLALNETIANSFRATTSNWQELTVSVSPLVLILENMDYNQAQLTYWRCENISNR